MTVLGIILLVAILLAVIALVAVAVVATLGLDADQARLKKSLRWAGAVLCSQQVSWTTGATSC
jgi:hypothetical protein